MTKGKFERIKPHVNVGTIGHIGNSNRAGLGRAIAKVLISTTTVTLTGNGSTSGVVITYTMDGNNGPMEDPRSRAVRRHPVKKRGEGSKYKKGRRWWE